MFVTYLTELLSFDNAVPTRDSHEQDLNGDTYTTSKSSHNSDTNGADVAKSQSADVYLVPDEAMEEIPFEVSRTSGIIMPPPHGSSSMPDEDDDSSSNAIVNGESKQKNGFLVFGGSGSKSKSGADDDDGAVVAVPLSTNKQTDVESELSGGEYDKVVGTEPVPEKAPSSSHRNETQSNKKKWLVCLAAVLLVILAVAVPCAILVPRNNAAKTNTAANIAGEGSEGGGSDTGQTSFAPTAAPTPVNAELPQECQPVYDSLDSCLANEITKAEADSCIDCVFGFLPDNSGPCEPLVASVCSVLAQCECLSCTDELQAYLDCQSECQLDCGF
jgi:hypothetical protein